MQLIAEQLTSAFGQVLFALAIGGIAYAFSRYFFKSLNKNGTFRSYLGLKYSKLQVDRVFYLVLFGSVLYGWAATWIQFHWSAEMKALVLDESSPFYKIARLGWSSETVAMGVVYCFLQAGAAEEILFRGLIARRCIARFGFTNGNILQAFIFWLMHFLIFGLITGVWVSGFQLFTFCSVFPMGLLLTHMNHRKLGDSIFPSWLIHSTANFTTVLTLTFLLNI